MSQGVEKELDLVQYSFVLLGGVFQYMPRGTVTAVLPAAWHSEC